MAATSADTPSTSAGLFDLAMADATSIEEMEAGCAHSPEQAGQQIGGRYILRSVIGEGGAGQVWRAEQTAPVKRDVAIKIVRPGLLTKPVSARFEREHQVLARMEHPHIAAVFDAGELPDGRTYFVMERVSGSAITQWCKEKNTPVRERLEIFVQACMAVQHAHQRGILHRDLKPSNVMVVEVDGKPLVKVIDFGIAKTLEGDLAAGADATLCGMVLGTPRYMSPEQADLSGQDVDIRTDVYALGVLLYELLTGTTPIQNDAGNDPPLAELLQRVRQDDIEKPSQRVQHGSAAEAAQTRMLARMLRGELDWITLRALQRDREARYPTVLNLAEDVQHYLRNEPVSAGPPGMAYQMKKWLVRNRTVVSTAAALIVSLAGGLAATSWALRREEAQRQEVLRQMQDARTSADLAQQVSAQLEDLLNNARKYADAGMNTQILRKLADECAAGMPRFANQPKAEASLAIQLARLYSALEEPSRAQPWLVRYWELLVQTEGEHSPAALEALYTLGWRQIGMGEAPKAVETLRRTLSGYEQLARTGVRKSGQMLRVRKELAHALSRSDQHEEAVVLMAEVMKSQGDLPPAERAVWLRDQAEILKRSGRMAEAVSVLRHATESLPVGDDFANQRVYLLTMMADITGKREDHEQALAASAERLHTLEEQPGAEHSKLLNALISHAFYSCTVPGCPGGEEAARRALTMARSAGHESRLADAWISLSETLRMKHQFRDSEHALREAILEVGQTKAEAWRRMELHRRLGDLLTARSDFAEALKEYETAAAGWFDSPSSGRPPEKERLIFGSFIKFWELAAKANSPVADENQLKIWQSKLQEWEMRQK
ncbi:protein kinase domain-containing protein [Prosthecobacter sp.]|uniref:protein kinase domain-containing protein n=1 Tax=Prosthecobacter sp. TaxID=1965333 RepID=UPI003783B6F1